MNFSVKTADPVLYNVLKENSLKMRNNPTQAEAIAWELLRDKKLNAKFRRQHIIGEYIVDFINLNTGLIVEIDGGYHNLPSQTIRDAKRTDFLNNLGYTVLRFSNEEVICNPDYFLDKISFTLNKLKTQKPPTPL